MNTNPPSVDTPEESGVRSTSDDRFYQLIDQSYEQLPSETIFSIKQEGNIF